MTNKMFDLSMGPEDVKAGMTRFRKKPVEIFAREMICTFEIKSTSSLSGSSGRPSDWLIVTDKGDIYACKSADFFEYYEKVKEPEQKPESDDFTSQKDRLQVTEKNMSEGVSVFFRKPTQVSAKQMDCYFFVSNSRGIMFGSPGDWAVQEFKGEMYVCNNKVFSEIYVEANVIPVDPTLPAPLPPALAERV